MSEKRSRLESRSRIMIHKYGSRKGKSCNDIRSAMLKKRAVPQAPTTAFILDSGAYSVKAGISTDENPFKMPNCIMKAKSERKRPFIGDEVEECRDLSGLFYLLPCEKGYVTRWDVQKPIWDYVFQHAPLLPDKPLIMTQPLFNFRSIQECIDEIFFEEYDVKSMFRTNPTDLIQYEYAKKIIYKDTDCLVIDSGYSFTHIVPYVNGFKYFPGIKRIDVGGKLLTNYLKDIISYRQLHVMEETHVINQVKEDVCYVSQDLQKDMDISSSSRNNTNVTNYVLPDFNNIRRGYIQPPTKPLGEALEGYQILKLNNERFTVPEILLRPSNIGMEQQGIAETVVSSILKCPKSRQEVIANNIILAGGNAKFPGLRERIEHDVQHLAPFNWKVKVFLPENPIEFAWSGGTTLANSYYLHSVMVSKHDYEEHGSNYTYKKFNNLNLMKKKQEETHEEDDDEDDIDLDPSLLNNPYSHLAGKGRVVNEIFTHLGSNNVNGSVSNQKQDGDHILKLFNLSKLKTNIHEIKRRRIQKDKLHNDNLSGEKDKMKLKFW